MARRENKSKLGWGKHLCQWYQWYHPYLRPGVVFRKHVEPFLSQFSCKDASVPVSSFQVSRSNEVARYCPSAISEYRESPCLFMARNWNCLKTPTPIEHIMLRGLIFNHTVLLLVVETFHIYLFSWLLVIENILPASFSLLTPQWYKTLG